MLNTEGSCGSKSAALACMRRSLVDHVIEKL